MSSSKSIQRPFSVRPPRRFVAQPSRRNPLGRNARPLAVWLTACVAALALASTTFAQAPASPKKAAQGPRPASPAAAGKGAAAAEKGAATTTKGAALTKKGGATSASDHARIERGRYLTNIIGCHDCHTPKKLGPNGPEPDMTRQLSGQPQGNPVPAVPAGVLSPQGWIALTNGDLSMWAGPWGVSFAINLTPDLDTGIGSWKLDMFLKAMRTGKHMGEGRPILPPMPWQDFGLAKDEDLGAIFAYLQSIPAIHNAVPDPIPPAKP